MPLTTKDESEEKRQKGNMANSMIRDTDTADIAEHEQIVRDLKQFLISLRIPRDVGKDQYEKKYKTVSQFLSKLNVREKQALEDDIHKKILQISSTLDIQEARDLFQRVTRDFASYITSLSVQKSQALEDKFVKHMSPIIAAMNVEEKVSSEVTHQCIPSSEHEGLDKSVHLPKEDTHQVMYQTNEHESRNIVNLNIFQRRRRFRQWRRNRNGRRYESSLEPCSS